MGTRIVLMAFAGFDRFVVGANLPWIGYGTDIGSSAWYPAGGLSAQSAALDLLDRTFATLAAHGVQLVRVFLPVLVDFHLCKARQIVKGVQTGGRARLLTDPSARVALMDLVLRPILERYGQDETIAAWDVMNEPEWCIRRGLFSRRRGVTFDALQEFLGQVVHCVHEHARQAVTIGCAGTARLDLVQPLGLDFYQVHWYEKFGRAALERPVADLGLADCPVLLGECPGRSQAVANILETAKRAGYSGALVWSVLADDDQSAYQQSMVDWIGKS